MEPVVVEGAGQRATSLGKEAPEPEVEGGLHHGSPLCAPCNSDFDRRQKTWSVWVFSEAAVHHFAWLDATGRLFGLCEVCGTYLAVETRLLKVGHLELPGLLGLLR